MTLHDVSEAHSHHGKQGHGAQQQQQNQPIRQDGGSGMEQQRQALDGGKPTLKEDDVVDLNIGGTFMSISRSTLCQVEGSRLAEMFSVGAGKKGGGSEFKYDSSGAIFLDLDPDLMSKLIAHLRHASLVGPDAIIAPPEVPPDMMGHWMALLGTLGLKDFIYRLSPLPSDLRFAHASHDLSFHNGGREVRKNGHNRISGMALTEPAMRTSTMWRIKISRLCSDGKITLGVGSRPDPNDRCGSYTTNGWGGDSLVYSPHYDEKARWEGRLAEGNEVVMKLDMVASALFMHVPKGKRGQTFKIDLPPQPAWYFFTDIFHEFDSIRILPANSGDASLFP